MTTSWTALLLVLVPTPALAEYKPAGPPDTASMYIACHRLQKASSSVEYDMVYKDLERRWRPENVNRTLAFCNSPRFKRMQSKK